MADPIDDGIAEILTLALERPVAPGEALTRDDEPRWDSLKHLEIIFAIEGAFGVAFTPEEIGEVNSVAGLAAKVRG